MSGVPSLSHYGPLVRRVNPNLHLLFPFCEIPVVNTRRVSNRVFRRNPCLNEDCYLAFWSFLRYFPNFFPTSVYSLLPGGFPWLALLPGMTSLSPVPTSSHATNWFPLLNSHVFNRFCFMARWSERVHFFHWLGLDYFRWIRSSSFGWIPFYWLQLVSKLPIYITILTCLCWTVVIFHITLAHRLSFYDTLDLLDSKFGSTERAVFSLGLRRKLIRDSPLRMG